METFKIEVQELLSRTINVQADNIKEAVSIANKMYKQEDIVLDYNDLKNQDIIPHSLITEKEQLISVVIDYLYLDEEKHFEESDRPNDHIFLKLKRLRMLNG